MSLSKQLWEAMGCPPIIPGKGLAAKYGEGKCCLCGEVATPKLEYPLTNTYICEECFTYYTTHDTKTDDDEYYWRD
jgi:hypothetical protein